MALSSSPWSLLLLLLIVTAVEPTRDRKASYFFKNNGGGNSTMPPLCLYFTSATAGALVVVEQNPNYTQPHPIGKGSSFSNDVDSTSGLVVYTAYNVGLLPQGIEFYGGIVYISSLETIVALSYANRLVPSATRPVFFDVFKNNNFQSICQPGSLVADNDILFIACIGTDSLYALIKLSLSPLNYGTFEIQLSS